MLFTLQTIVGIKPNQLLLINYLLVLHQICLKVVNLYEDLYLIFSLLIILEDG